MKVGTKVFSLLCLLGVVLFLAPPAAAVNVADTAYVEVRHKVPTTPPVIRCGPGFCDVIWDTTTAAGVSLWLESNGCDGLQKQADPDRAGCPEADTMVVGEHVQVL